MSDSSLPLKALQKAFEHSSAYLEGLNGSPVSASAELDVLRQRLSKPLSNCGMAADEVIEELIADVNGGLHASAGGRFFGWVTGGAVPSALAADWLTAAWDQNAHTYVAAPAAVVVEEIAGEWLKSIFGLPPSVSFALVTGCQMAHATCLAAARHAVLSRQGWDVEKNGLYGAPPIQVLSSSQLHSTVPRALRLLGMGTSQLRTLACDEAGRLPTDALEAVLAQVHSSPVIVVLQAGDVNTGAYDDFEALIPVAKRYGAWVHIDGAFGLWAAASPRYRHLLNGVAAADSWASDGHKWLNVPYDCGYAFVADIEAHGNAMALRAAYISHSADVRDPMNFTPESSRRARGFSTYAAIRELGRNGLAELVERCCAHAKALVLGIGQLPGAEVVCEPQINQGLVRFPDSRPNATLEDHDRRTDKVIAKICASGDAYFSGTTWKGLRAMRVSVSNWRTNEADVERAIGSVARVLLEAS